MLQLYQFAPAWGLNLSPFCMKVEIYCQLTGIPYEVKTTVPFKGPRGKLPFIVDEGQTVPDSGRIIEYLKAKHGDPLDAKLTPAQRALGHLLRQTCEESLYFALLRSRWLDDETWPKLRDAFFGPLPPVLRSLLPILVRSGIRKELHGQGYGRYPWEELYALAAQDLGAISQQLETHRFAVGDTVSSYDASLYAFIFNILHVPLDSPLKRTAEELAPLGRYLEHVEQHLQPQSIDT